jgi:hypothetical protein
MTAPARAIPPLPGPYSAAEAIDRLLIVAASQIGYREGRSSNGSYNNDNAYGVWYKSNKVSWCAQWVSWVANGTGYLDKIIPKHQYTPSGANWFLARGQLDRKPVNGDKKVGTPRRGDIMYVFGPVSGEKAPRVHHVGIVEKVLSGNRIQTIEGNTNTSGSSQGNGVYRLTRTVTSRLYFARPNYAAVVQKRPAPPKTAPPQPPKLPRITGYSLAGLKAAAATNSLSGNYAAQRLQAMSSLKVLGFAKTVYPAAGVNFHAHFRTAWAGWQRSLGYRGADADGIPGETSIRRLASRTGLRYIA